jgi:hypothetical protein
LVSLLAGSTDNLKNKNYIMKKKIFKNAVLSCILVMGMAACSNGTSSNMGNSDTASSTNSNKMDTTMHDTSTNRMSTDTGAMQH